MDILSVFGAWSQLADACMKMALAVVLAGMLGLERERKGRVAGLRTHVIVCLGSTLAMMVADYASIEWVASGANGFIDKTRTAQGIITGVGFLGAGTIIHEGNIHRGLTTAAMVWFAAALGIAIGDGYFLISVCATAVVLLCTIGFGYAERYLPSEDRFSLNIRMPRGLKAIDGIERLIQERGCQVVESRLRVEGREDRVDLSFQISSPKRAAVQELVQVIQERFESIQRIVVER
jgi:putative Mg2+ transporter-C (MgtC) family protein